jgi:hypothetical protein
MTTLPPLLCFNEAFLSQTIPNNDSIPATLSSPIL